MFSGCLSVRHQLVNTISYKPLGRFHQIYNFDSFGNNDKLNEILRSKVKVTVRLKMIEIGFLAEAAINSSPLKAI